jgi:hypothetical protein
MLVIEQSLAALIVRVFGIKANLKIPVAVFQAQFRERMRALASKSHDAEATLKQLGLVALE